MKISEVCKFEVKAEIDHLVKKNGISRNEACKQMSSWFTEILGKEIKPGTIRQKDLRARKELATNVAKPRSKNRKKPSKLDKKIKIMIKDIGSLKYNLVQINGFLVDIQSKRLQVSLKKELKCLQDHMSKILDQYAEYGL